MYLYYKILLSALTLSLWFEDMVLPWLLGPLQLQHIRSHLYKKTIQVFLGVQCFFGGGGGHMSL